MTTGCTQFSHPDLVLGVTVVHCLYYCASSFILHVHVHTCNILLLLCFLTCSSSELLPPENSTDSHSMDSDTARVYHVTIPGTFVEVGGGDGRE